MTDATEPLEAPSAEPPESPDAVQRLQDRLRHHFGDFQLLRQALTHRSYVNEAADPEVRDNERLEFLGDAVIDLIVSMKLMQLYPTAREGRLSKIRASLVSEAGLARIAEQLTLGAALRLGRGEELSGGRAKPSLLADAFEAVIAAVYLDAGLEVATRVLLDLLHLPTDGSLERGDAKTALQQLVQATRHLTPTYRLAAESGPDHQKTFLVEILVGGEVLGSGAGRTKKEAEQRAAAAVLAQLEPT